MLFNYHSLLVTSHIREKIHKGINIMQEISDYRFLNPELDEININFVFKNLYNNKAIFYSFLLLMEKLTLSKFKFIKMKKTIADFNIKKGLISGASYSIRGYKKDRFIQMLTNYSLKKMNQNMILSVDNLMTKKGLIDFIHTNRINFGIQKILFHGILSTNDTDYDFFYPILNKYINGMNINLCFNFHNFLVNKLYLSHHNINIF